MSKTTAKLFEISCTRCGGSGHFSMNAMGSTVCYKCNGKKVIMVSRLPAAPMPCWHIMAKNTGNNGCVKDGISVGDICRVWDTEARTAEKAMEKFNAFMAKSGAFPFWKNWDIGSAFAAPVP